MSADEPEILPQAVRSVPSKVVNASLRLLKPVLKIETPEPPVKKEATDETDSNWGPQEPVKISELPAKWSFWTDPNDPPLSIVHFSEAGTRILYRRPENTPGEFAPSFRQYQNYYFASQSAVRAIATERAAAAESRGHEERKKDDEHAAESGARGSTPETAKSSERLPPYAYEVAFFHPGKRDDGSTLVPVNRSILGAIQGPDYSFTNFSADDDEKMRANMSTVLSLGHGGEILLRVIQNGIVKDESGADFTLFENAFIVPGGLELGLEFGAVGISETDKPEDFKWFPCDPGNSLLSGCFGAVPTKEGGDKFDIGELGFKQIRYIWIKDLGINKNKTSKWPTEGCDLDAVRLDHAYTSP